MENQLEKLTEENQENYQKYLSRMSESTLVSTKGLIPIFTKGTRILDVGCGSGTLLKTIYDANPTLKLMGIDMNSHSVQHCKETYAKLPIEFRHCSLEELYAEWNESEEREKVHHQFDCIIFGSVLHEISSYAEHNKYTAKPIIDILTKAYSLLMPDGRIIIRDGLDTESNAVFQFCWKNESDFVYWKKFLDEFHWHDIPWDYEMDRKKMSIPWRYAKEFLCKYTWGEDSWQREIREQYGILTETEWIRSIEYAGFHIHMTIKSAEEYLRYFEKIIQIHPLCKKLIKDMTIVLVAQKSNQ